MIVKLKCLPTKRGGVAEEKSADMLFCALACQELEQMGFSRYEIVSCEFKSKGLYEKVIDGKKYIFRGMAVPIGDKVIKFISEYESVSSFKY